MIATALTPTVAIAQPATSWLVLAVVATVATLFAVRYTAVSTRPPRPIEIGRSRPRASNEGHLEPPAVVGLLTNGYRVPTSAVTATVLDLASRNWIQLAWADTAEVVVLTRGTGRAGDQLAPFEQQVLNHLTARAHDGVVGASTLAAVTARLDRRWWRRFRTEVIRDARTRRLTRPRWTASDHAAPLAACALAAFATWTAHRNGTHELSLREAPTGRILWTLCLVTLVVVAVRSAHALRTSGERPTDAGERRAGQWLGHRRHLVDLIPDRASVVTTSDQQLVLAHATVLGVAPSVTTQIPVVPVDPRRAWSDAGGLPHVVTVRYPFRPGYGRPPALLAVVGIVVAVVAQVAQRFLHRVSDGDALSSLVDTFPDQRDRIEQVVGVIGDLCWLPTIWAAWAIASGVIDLVATRRRRGLVVRVRRPIDVAPSSRLLRSFAGRDRFASFVAVDDGRRDQVTAWLADERRTVPEGVQAEVVATYVLGHVRRAEPTGTSTRPER